MKINIFSFIFYVFGIVLFSCSGNDKETVDIPENILGEEQFARVLMDFALAESAASLNIKNVTPSKSDSVYAFDPLKDNGVRKSQYDSTVRFYSEHPLLYKKVYEDVLVKLKEEESARDGAKADSAAK